MELVELTALAITIIAFQRAKQKRSSHKRKCWSKEWLLKRHLYGVGSTLFTELAVQEPNDFRYWMRLDESSFYDILDRIKPYIQRKDTNMREYISPEQRLAVTLRYTATGKQCVQTITNIIQKLVSPSVDFGLRIYLQGSRSNLYTMRSE